MTNQVLFEFLLLNFEFESIDHIPSYIKTFQAFNSEEIRSEDCPFQGGLRFFSSKIKTVNKHSQ